MLAVVFFVGRLSWLQDENTIIKLDFMQKHCENRCHFAIFI